MTCAGHQHDESENEGRTDMDMVVLTRSSWARGRGLFWLESLAGSRASKVVVGWNPRLGPSGPDCIQTPGLVRLWVWALAADSAFVGTGKERSAKPGSPGPGEQVSFQLLLWGNVLGKAAWGCHCVGLLYAKRRDLWFCLRSKLSSPVIPSLWKDSQD